MLSAPARLRIPIGAPLPGEGELEIAIDVFAPTQLSEPAIVLFCMPGGGMNRKYFDLGGPGDSMSFAAAMSARGFVVVTMDHLGVGESSHPRDGFAITSAVAAQANAVAFDEIARRLRDGVLHPALPALRHFTPIGVGHSMGGLIMTVQQDARRDFAAMMLLGFGTCGMPEVLSDDDRAALARPDRGLSELPRLARQRFGGDAYPPIPRAEGASSAARALAAAQDGVLSVPAVHSMIPGSIKEEIARLDVPIFIGVGDRDIVGPPRMLPAEYERASDITLFIVEKCGHHPFVSPDTPRLLARAGDWVRAQAKE